MSAIVELVFEPDCPNVEAARASLRAALAEAGLPARWTEHRIGDPAAPEHTRGYGSPTILVGGRDVTGEARSGNDGCCRVYPGADGALRGVPEVALIAAALAAAGGA